MEHRFDITDATRRKTSPASNAHGQQTGKAKTTQNRGGIFHFVGIFVGINQNTLFDYRLKSSSYEHYSIAGLATIYAAQKKPTAM